jgi:hypothetical protein
MFSPPSHLLFAASFCMNDHSSMTAALNTSGTDLVHNPKCLSVLWDNPPILLKLKICLSVRFHAVNKKNMSPGWLRLTGSPQKQPPLQPTWNILMPTQPLQTAVKSFISYVVLVEVKSQDLPKTCNFADYGNSRASAQELEWGSKTDANGNSNDQLSDQSVILLSEEV